MKKIEAVIRPTQLAKVCAALEKVGHGKIFISPVADVMRIRTAEHGVCAL